MGGLDPDDAARGRDLSRPHHLPNLRAGKQPPHPSWLPRQRRGTTPQMIGRYPDFDVFDARDTWDAATARVIDERMALVAGGPLSFFHPEEAATARAFCDLCVANDADPRVPVTELIDEKLAAGHLDGYQYADMPDDRDTWHLVLGALDEIASSRYAKDSFADLDGEAQFALVAQMSEGSLKSPSMDVLNPKRAWSVCMRMILAAFYSHPWAWNEIGFGGPAYPRGFMRLGPISTREPFERPGATSEDPVRAAMDLQS
ncbi:MAG: gluconate 2-dehydrogenase subunit 3 family protein [Acidimicrobiales bacterium]